MQGLFDFWRHDAFTWENEARTTRVVTYFVNHQEMLPRCDAGRPVHLYENYATWEETLKRAWQDRAQPFLPIDYFLVTPMPPNLEHGVAAYVLMVQARREELTTSLVSIYGPNQRLQGRSAVTTSTYFFGTQLIYELGLQRHCFGPDSMLLCDVYSQDRLLPPEQPIVGRCGDSFIVRLRINARTQPSSGNRFLQSQVRFSRVQQVNARVIEEPLFSVSSPMTCFPDPALKSSKQLMHIPSADGPYDCASEHVYDDARDSPFRQDPSPQRQAALLQDTLPPWWQEVLQQFWIDGCTENQDEGPVMYVLTWFLHGRHQRRNDAPRVLRLDRHWHHWWNDLRELWQDSLEEMLPAAVGIVRPTPPLAPRRHHSLHLILHQATMDESVGVVTQLFHGQHWEAFGQFAHVMRSMTTAADIINVAGAQLQCRTPGRGCVIQHGERIASEADPPFFLPDYASVIVHVDHPAYGVTEPSFDESDPQSERNIKKIHGDTAQPCERQTDRLVAHTCRPQASVTPVLISLEEQIPVAHHCIASDGGSDIISENLTSVVFARLVPGHDGLLLPSFLEIAGPGTEAQIEFELIAWGHHCKAIKFGGHDTYVCYHRTWSPPDQAIHYVYGSEQGQDNDQCFLHTSLTGTMTTKDHMRLLHQRGCTKAAIIEDEQVWQTIRRVTFVCHQPMLQQQTPIREPTPWPLRQPVQSNPTPPFRSQDYADAAADCRLTLGFSLAELETLLWSGLNSLCTDLSMLDIPDTTKKALASCTTLERIHRYVIFTDGSSVGGLRHQPPQLVDEQGFPDSWAFIVLAEQYLDDETSALQFLGWQAQPVRYTSDSEAFIGTQHTGSDAAEREAMFWATFWRLTNNTRTPTVFCSDSRVTCLQTTGRMGTSDYDETFRCLRGTYQALEAFMPRDMVCVQHVHGHANDPWNDLADCLAKHVRTPGYYLRRQPVSLSRWKHMIPFLWMFLNDQAGLPPLRQQGFEAVAPDLPSDSYECETPSQPCSGRSISFMLSLATANVQSLQRSGRDGPGNNGKVQFLREQFKAHGLQVLGIQEARTPQMCGMQDNVLRISSGHCKNQYGVELWIDLDRPYACIGRRSFYFSKHHFVVLFSDPRVLIVRVQADYFEAIFVVAHAPHSGYQRQERELWWQMLSDQVASCKWGTAEKLYVLLDANATAGEGDGTCVGPKDDQATCSTNFLRDFLHRHDLCLPATFPVHEGPTETWTTPDGGHKSRIDHVAVPVDQCDHCTFSATLPTIDLCQVIDDHVPVGLQLE